MRFFIDIRWLGKGLKDSYTIRGEIPGTAFDRCGDRHEKFIEDLSGKGFVVDVIESSSVFSKTFRLTTEFPAVP